MVNNALIIANDRFSDPTIPPLSSPVSDGHKLKALLEREDVGGYNVELCANATSLEVRHAVQEFFDSGAPDHLQLLIISSHGLKDRWSRLYFATADTNKARVAASSLEPRFIRERMDDSNAGRKVLIIDACYSGAFLDGMVHKAADLNISSQDFGNSSAGGTTIITASSKVQIAGEKEIDGSTQSVFTRCMIEGIATGAADANKCGTITLTELYDYVTRRLKSEAPGQTPQWLDMSHGGPIVIARNPTFRAVALPEELLGRIGSRNRAERISAVEDLEDIVRTGGAEGQLAGDALRGLAMDDSHAVRELARAILDRVLPSPQAAAARPLFESTGVEVTKAGFVRRNGNRLSLWGKSFIFILGGLRAMLIGLLALALVVGLVVTGLSRRTTPIPAIDNVSDVVGNGASQARITPEAAVVLGAAQSVEKNYVEAFNNYKFACDRDYPRGCTNLGVVYENGEGVPKNYMAALKNYRKACDRDDLMGCSYLSIMFHYGTGVNKQYSAALKLYNKACVGDEMVGCTYLGVMYDEALGVQQDYANAARLYLKACDADFAAGCGFLAEMYESGHGFMKSISRSRTLYAKARKLDPTLAYAKDGLARLKDMR